jgi:2-polyprenyl-3-methyl-5-hydroxy-6-metoxy-1,4-benzoquinol methylase
MTTFDPVKYKEIEREVYSRTAESCARYGGAIFGSLAAPLLEGAGLKSGQKVLDVACGIGIPLLSTARLVVPDGLLIVVQALFGRR